MTQKEIARESASNSHIAHLKSDIASGSIPDPGPIREATDLLQITSIERVSPVTLRQWRNGTRAAPSWFVALLCDRLAELQSRASGARERLAQYRGGRGQAAGLRDWWKAKKQRDRLPGRKP